MKELLRQVRESNSSEAYSQLKTKVENTYYNIYHRMVERAAISQVDKDNFFESLDQMLISCIYSFDPERGMQFNTYFHSMARFKALNLIGKQKSVKTDNVDFDMGNDDFNLEYGEIFENQSAEDNSTEIQVEFYSFMDKIRNSGILDNEINFYIFDKRVSGEKTATIVKGLQDEFKFSQETAYKKIKKLNNTIRKYYE